MALRRQLEALEVLVRRSAAILLFMTDHRLFLFFRCVQVLLERRDCEA
jgi:hypothetical protein